MDLAITALNFHDIYNRADGGPAAAQAFLARVFDLPTNVFDPAIRGRTDRFLLELRKPK